MSAPVTGTSREERKVLSATLVGTTIEWYDFFIYAQAAGLVFAHQFFAPAGSENQTLAQIIAWASLGISFLFRPLGAILAGHLGDRYGRRLVLALTLILMGAATTLIGILPTYNSWGVAAPILLVLLRILQGFSAGGEWGGAALLAVEHAPRHRRGYFGAYPQIGVPLGLILATLMLLIITLTLGPEAYKDWAWRLPFLVSIVLVVVGFLIRRSVEESPVFKEMQQRSAESSAPLPELMKTHAGLVLRGALIFAANNASGYMVIAFMGSYAVKALGISQPVVFGCIVVAGIAWTVTTLWAGALSDQRGRVWTFAVGFVLLMVWAIPAWLVLDLGSGWALLIALLGFIPGLALSYGPQSAMYAEMFPSHVRYSGVSIAYALGSILGGAFAATIAQAILDSTGHSWPIGIYLAAMCLPALGALFLAGGLPRWPINEDDKAIDGHTAEEVAAARG